MNIDERLHSLLRESLADSTELFGGGEDCPEADKLVLSGRGELGPAKDEEVLLHVARCTACATGWRIARQVGSRREPSIHPAAVIPLYRRTWMRMAGAAAVLVVAVSVGLLFVVPDGEGPTIHREQEDELLRSLLEEDQSLPRDRFILRWSTGPEGTVYDVVVTSHRMEPLTRGLGLERAEFHVPAQVLESTESGSRILWQVTAYLPDTRRIESKTFFVKVE
jgi:hypothetical protein